MNKLIAGLVIILGLVLFPKLSVSKGTAPDTIVLGQDNVLIINGEINGDTAGQAIAKAKELDLHLSVGLVGKYRSKKPIYVFLNTPGGSIQSGLEMIEAFKGLGRPINTVTLFAASMGFQLVQNLDDRLILKNGVLMSHHAFGQSEGEFGGQAPTQMDNRNQLWLDRVRELDEQTVKRTNGKQTYESYTKQYDHETWLTGTKSVQQGYADRIVTVRCDSTLTGVTTHHVNFLGMDIQYDLDNCPLNTSPQNVRVAAPDGKAVTNEIAADIKNRFQTSYLNKERQVIPMYWWACME